MHMGFQTQVNRQPGVAQAGDFADANIRMTVIAGPGGFIAGALPRAPIVGQFAWGSLLPAGAAAANQSGLTAATTGQQVFGTYQGDLSTEIGFVHRAGNPTIIVNYLGQTTEVVQPGLIMTLHNKGGFWAQFAAGAAVGQKVFALYNGGGCVAMAAGTSGQVAGLTASLANTGVLTVTVVGSGTVRVNDVATDAAGNSYAITSQLSGTVGGVGTYQTSLLGVTQASGAVTTADRVETAFYVDSPANAGELAKISTWG